MSFEPRRAGAWCAPASFLCALSLCAPALAQAADGGESDQALLKEIEALSVADAGTMPPDVMAAKAESAKSGGYFSNLFNPAMSVNGLFLASVLLYSQAATARALMPLGLSLGIAPQFLIGSFPAVNGYFLIPNYGTIIAAINFDEPERANVQPGLGAVVDGSTSGVEPQPMLSSTSMRM